MSNSQSTTPKNDLLATKTATQIQTELWTDTIDEMSLKSIETLRPALCESFSQFPFMLHNALVMQEEANGDIFCVATMNQHLVGNVLYGILHGGVTATMLDSIGGLKVMLALCDRSMKNPNTDYQQLKKQVGRVATTDFRVDYLSAGKGQQFIATAEIIRLGSRQATCQMKLVNDTGKLIAIGTASYAY